MKKSIDINIDVLQVVLFLSWLVTLVMSFMIDNDSLIIISTIYLVGWILYKPKNN